jgi:adenylosuccinate synthase
MQWGDEGKGKVIDLLSEKGRHIVRAQGGNNAGHTIVAKGKEYKFHLIPSGIIYPHTQCYIGGGTVLDPSSFLEEIKGLEKEGISPHGRLFLSKYLHLVFPYHKEIDRRSEIRKGAQAVGTTGRGIGPCYSDRINRCGIRLADLMHPAHFKEILAKTLAIKNHELQTLYDAPPCDFDLIFNEYLEFGEKLKPFIAPVEEMLYAASKNKESILYEGAQGAMLDVTFGSYPFVTSSCTLAAGVFSGSGMGPSFSTETIGVTKAYTTRVGHGALPTELNESELKLFPDHGAARELGTTTGRKRRMGWLDLFLLKHTICLNGATSLAITKLDILDHLDELKICVGYKGCSSFPTDLNHVVPIYETHPGWKSSTRDAFVYQDLPDRAKAYLRRIEEFCEVPISIISVGPEREKTLWLDQFFNQ